MNPQVLEAFREDGKRLRSLRDRKSTRLNSSHSQISYAVSFDRKSTRLNSSHSQISYAVFCLKKKTKRGPNLARPDPALPHADLLPLPHHLRGHDRRASPHRPA